MAVIPSLPGVVELLETFGEARFLLIGVQERLSLAQSIILLHYHLEQLRVRVMRVDNQVNLCTACTRALQLRPSKYPPIDQYFCIHVCITAYVRERCWCGWRS